MTPCFQWNSDSIVSSAVNIQFSCQRYKMKPGNDVPHRGGITPLYARDERKPEETWGSFRTSSCRYFRKKLSMKDLPVRKGPGGRAVVKRVKQGKGRHLAHVPEMETTETGRSRTLALFKT